MFKILLNQLFIVRIFPVCDFLISSGKKKVNLLWTVMKLRFLRSKRKVYGNYIPLGGALISGVGGVLSGIIGGIASASQRAAAEKASQDALAQIQAIGAPPNLAQQIILQKFQSAGVLTPEIEHNINLGVSQVSQIKDNAATTNAQNQALQLIQQRAQGGLSPQDQANLAHIKNQAATSLQGKLQQIQQNAAQRGMGNSGAALAAQLSAAQGGAQQESEQGMQQGAIASQNALDALRQQGALSGQIRGQDFGENQARAQAADALNN